MGLPEAQDRRLSELMTQAQDGDQQAYRQLLHEIRFLLKSFLERRVGVREAAEDVIQEVLISVHRARHTYDRNKPFAPWMFAIARCRLADHWRRVFRRVPEESLDGLTDFVAAEPRENQTLSDMKDYVRNALSDLPEKQRKVVNLLKFEGLSIRDAAKKMAMTEVALKVTAHRAYKSLRRRLEAQTNGYE